MSQNAPDKNQDTTGISPSQSLSLDFNNSYTFCKKSEGVLIRKAILMILVGVIFIFIGLWITYLFFENIFDEKIKVEKAIVERERLELQYIRQFTFWESHNITTQKTKLKSTQNLFQNLEKINNIIDKKRRTTKEFLFSFLVQCLGPSSLGLGIVIVICGSIWLTIILEKISKRKEEERLILASYLASRAKRESLLPGASIFEGDDIGDVARQISILQRNALQS